MLFVVCSAFHVSWVFLFEPDYESKLSELTFEQRLSDEIGRADNMEAPSPKSGFIPCREQMFVLQMEVDSCAVAGQ